MSRRGVGCCGGLDINFDLVIKNGRVFTPQGLIEIDIWVRDGLIRSLGGSHRAEEKIDAKGMLVLPGAIDAHVHFRDPGPNYKEDWASGSASAAAGGVTTVIDQPNTNPRTLDAASFEMKQQIAKARSYVDFAINGGAGNIEELARSGATSIGEIFSYEHSEPELEEILERVPGAGLLATLHAEDSAIIKEATARLAGRHDPQSYSLSRPPQAEARAIDFALSRSKRLHVCHLSSSLGLQRITDAKKKGLAVTCEVAPHHLLFNIGDYEGQKARLKMNPPLRSQEDCENLWRALRDGSIDILASDHAPHLPEEKDLDIWEAPPGVPGVETMLPLMLMAVRRNHLTLEELVRAVSTNPARIFGLARKGSIEIGRDADLVIVDGRAVSTIDPEKLHSRAEWTPYTGMQAIFPRMTIVRGSVVYDGQLAVRAGYGRFLSGPGGV